MQTNSLLAAIGAVMSKDGWRNFQKFEQSLKSMANEGLSDSPQSQKTTRKKLMQVALALGARGK